MGLGGHAIACFPKQVSTAPPLENCPQTGSLLDSQSLLFIIYNGGVEIYPNIVETSVCMIALLVHYTIWAFEAKIIASRMFSW